MGKSAKKNRQTGTSPQEGEKRKTPDKAAAEPKRKIKKARGKAGAETVIAGGGQGLRQAAEPEQKPRISLKEYKESIKTAVRAEVDNYRKDIDPHKYDALIRETKKTAKIMGVFAVITVAAASVLLLPELYFSGKVAAKTSVAGIEVGGQRAEEARQKLMVETERYLKTPLTFVLEDKKVSMTPYELGARISLDQTVNAMPVIRFRDTNPFLLAAGLLTSRDIPLSYTLDRESAYGKIEDKFNLKPKRAVNARLVYKDGEAAVEPEIRGVAMDRDGFNKTLLADMSGMKTDPVVLTLVPENPRITASMLEPQKDRLAGLVGGDLDLVSGDDSFKFKTPEHLDAIEFKEKTALQFKETGLVLPLALPEDNLEIAADSPVRLDSKLEVAFNQAKIEPFLQENFLKDIEIPTSGVTITRGKDGNINIDGKGEDGKSVPKKRLIAAMNLAVNHRLQDVPVPVVTEKAPVNISSDLQELGIKELIATGHTSYYGSPPNRMHNINVGISKYNGVLVKPGEEFSFNNILGEVDAKNGYLPEKVIKKNKAELEYGGGICQVSTTLYRAALLAGVPITERNPHSWKVSYYGQVLGHGLDATIYLGVSDVKFLNDTPAYILIQSYAEGANAYFKFYGTSDGRAVALDGPYGGGLSYKWYRILNKNGEETKETIVSNYKPIPPPDPPPEKPKEVAQKPVEGPTL